MGEKGNVTGVAEVAVTGTMGDRVEDVAATAARTATGIATAVVTGVTTDRALKHYEAGDGEGEAEPEAAEIENPPG